MSPADWELWRHAGMVTVGQAIWLSMNLEPVGGCIEDADVGADYRKRLAIASTWMDELPHTEGISSAVSSWRVSLEQFGFIAKSRGLVLPAEFPVSDEPPQDTPTKPKPVILKQSALITNIEPIMKEPGKLASLLSNAHKNGLNACRAPGGWNLGEVARWLLLKGYLKPEMSYNGIWCTELP